MAKLYIITFKQFPTMLASRFIAANATNRFRFNDIDKPSVFMNCGHDGTLRGASRERCCVINLKKVMLFCKLLRDLIRFYVLKWQCLLDSNMIFKWYIYYRCIWGGGYNFGKNYYLFCDFHQFIILCYCFSFTHMHLK